jgi:hypothetical protein
VDHPNCIKLYAVYITGRKVYIAPLCNTFFCCCCRCCCRQVDHPNCIKLYAVYITGRKVYIVTELVTGGELLDRWGQHNNNLNLTLCSCSQSHN